MEPVGTSRLRYVDAGDIEDTHVDFDGLDVRNAAGDKLGDVDGFIVDRYSDRPYYIVVDSGGWFRSQRYLLPIGHARLDSDNDSLRIDIERDAIERFPPFEASRFEQMSEEEAARFNEQTLLACCPAEMKGRRPEGRWDYEAWSHYKVPDWWQARPLGSVTSSTGTTDRLMSRPAGETRVPVAEPPVIHRDSTAILPESSVSPREHVTAGRTSSDLDETLNDRPLDPVTERAQPGDVLGIEHEGETTALGETGQDEAKRLRDAEEDARDVTVERKRPLDRE